MADTVDRVDGQTIEETVALLCVNPGCPNHGETWTTELIEVGEFAGEPAQDDCTVCGWEGVDAD